MQKIMKYLVAWFIGMMVPASAMATDTVFVTVNGRVVLQSHANTFVDFFIARQMARGVKDTPMLRNMPHEAMREGVIRNELLLQEAQKAGIDKREDVAREVAQAIHTFKEEIRKDQNGKSILDETELGWKLLGQTNEDTIVDMFFSALLAREVREGGIAKEVAIIESLRQLTIINAFVENYAERHPVDDAQLRTLYDAYKVQLGNTEYEVRHILLNDEASARAIINELAKGARFATLALGHSIDSDADYNLGAGYLGWQNPGNFPKPFADALKKLAKGEYTKTPVKSSSGYHVILVEDTRPLTVPAFDELKPRFLRETLSQQLENMVQGLRANARIQ
jgi:peptidyl-prolyl cis-trans isomerase C